jgi:predicted nucleic acid-binding protein
MNDDLARARSVYFDSNICIYLVEGIEPFRSLAVRAVEASAAGEARLISSELTVAECLYGAFKSAKTDYEAIYRRMFEAGGFVETVPVDRWILESAARLGAKLNIKLFDSIHLATAAVCRCDAYLTNDKRLQSVGDLKVVQLSA